MSSPPPKNHSLAAAALPVLCFALLTTEHLVHYPMALMMLGGLWRIARAPREVFYCPAVRRFGFAFACLWLPMLISLPDAENVAHAARTTFAYLHFLPAGIFVVLICREPRVRSLVLGGVGLIVAMWLTDALLQLATGHDVFGFPPAGDILTGAFYPKQRLGLVLAVMTPIYFLCVVQIAHRWPAAWALMLPFLLVVLLSLKRTAWIMLGVAVAGLLGQGCRRGHRALCRATLSLLLVLGLLTGVALATDAALRARVATTAGLLSGDFATMDQASSYRLSLWRTGLAIWQAHPVNGVGPRGYRYAYAEHALPDDFWLLRGGGQTHPHLMALEVAVETGLIGLVGYGGFLFVVWSRLKSPADDAQAMWAIAALAASFPLNAHLAFYGSYWSTLIWLLTALAMATPGGTAAGLLKSGDVRV